MHAAGGTASWSEIPPATEPAKNDRTGRVEKRGVMQRCTAQNPTKFQRISRAPSPFLGEQKRGAPKFRTWRDAAA